MTYKDTSADLLAFKNVFWIQKFRKILKLILRENIEDQWKVREIIILINKNLQRLESKLFKLGIRLSIKINTSNKGTQTTPGTFFKCKTHSHIVQKLFVTANWHLFVFSILLVKVLGQVSQLNKHHLQYSNN